MSQERESSESSCKVHGQRAVWSDFCAVAPSPEARERMQKELAKARSSGHPLAEVLGLARGTRRMGFDDGVIVPPDQFPLGTAERTIRSAAHERAPLRGSVRVIVVLVQFSDKALGATAAHFNDLFFSTGVLPHGSVKEYYTEVTGGLVDLTGQVVGPYTLPQTLDWYANNNFGIGKPSGTARANILARDAAVAANPNVNFGLYDNDGNGYVDAFVVVHAGPGGEATLNPKDIWSHKWVLPSAYAADGKQIYAYLTIPEDAKIGVCAHELGHLLFGFPDLYDTDNTSEGVGNWCLMGGGSWNGGGEIPAHPSAWCKMQQGWVGVTNVTNDGTISLPDVKTSRIVHRLWKDGTGGPEYFLLENRQRTGYDAKLPGDGLLIWHIDDAQSGNTDENHYKVGLVQADAKRDLEHSHNRGDGGDPYPGSSANTAFNDTSTPNSKAYGGQGTCVSVTGISSSGPTMSASVRVHCGKSLLKDAKDRKDGAKEGKELVKERKDLKDALRDQKDLFKDFKDKLEGKSAVKDFRDNLGKGFKDQKDQVERPGGGFGLAGGEASGLGTGLEDLGSLEARVSALEASVGLTGSAQPFIPSELRPDLAGGPRYGPEGDLSQRMAAGDRDAKGAYDTPPAS